MSLTDNRPAISVIIPVLGEGAIINRALDSVELSAGGVSHEIIVVDGDASGGTIGTVRRDGVMKLVSPRGRAVQMNRGAAAAKGGILLFLHADTALPAGSFEKITAALAGGSRVAGAFDLGFDSSHPWLRATRALGSLRSRLTRVPFGDQAHFIGRTYFASIGGYREIPLMEDAELMRRIRRRGDRIVILPDRAVTSARKWFEDGVYFTTLRNWSLQLLFAMGVPPERLVRFYYGKGAGGASGQY